MMANVEKVKKEQGKAVAATFRNGVRGARKAKTKEIKAPYSFPCRHLIYFKIGGELWLLA